MEKLPAPWCCPPRAAPHLTRRDQGGRVRTSLRGALHPVESPSEAPVFWSSSPSLFVYHPLRIFAIANNPAFEARQWAALSLGDHPFESPFHGRGLTQWDGLNLLFRASRNRSVAANRSLSPDHRPHIYRGGASCTSGTASQAVAFVPLFNISERISQFEPYSVLVDPSWRNSLQAADLRDPPSSRRRIVFRIHRVSEDIYQKNSKKGVDTRADLPYRCAPVRKERAPHNKATTA